MRMKALTFSVAILFLVLSCRLWAVETNPAPVAAASSGDMNSQETLRAYLQLQEQLHATQLAVEQNRKEAQQAAMENAEALAIRLQTIESALSSQRARELEAMQSSNRVMLIVAGSFATLGFIAMLLMAWFQSRTVQGLAEISSSMPGLRALGAPLALTALGPGEPRLVEPGAAEKSNLRLLGALEQLERRIHELEHTTATPLKADTNGNGDSAGKPEIPVDPNLTLTQDRSAMLLGKGQSMLNLDKPEAALACFDEALTLEPDNAEALVKKGTALERLQKLDEAIACYDRAIAADASMTVAYLHKGGLYNRMERYNEALACYERALRTQEKQG